MTVINYIKDFYVHHTLGEMFLILWFIYSAVITVWACIAEDDNALFFPFIFMIGGIILPIIWIEDLRWKKYKRKFIERIYNEYEISQYYENPDWLRRIALSKGVYYTHIHLCRDKKSNEYLVVDTQNCRESERFATLEEMELKKYKVSRKLFL